MLVHRVWIFVATFALIFWPRISACNAAITFLGPTPYLSAADSPFPVNGSNPNFFLEDFEDGQLNTPGIRQRDLFSPIFGGAFLGKVLGPGDNTDSVDADDGAIDGLGQLGHSFQSGVDFLTLTDPPGHNIQISFDFDDSALGFYPNAFGFVWTDGQGGSFNSVQVTTRLGEIITTPIVQLGDATRSASVTEDRFLGIIVDEGITSVQILSGYHSESDLTDVIEIDHLQYGLFVPEPSTICLVISFVALLRRRVSAHFLVVVLLVLASTSEAYGNPLHLELRHRLTAPEPLLGTGFGDSVEVFGNFLAISEPNRPDFNTGVSAAGQVHLYDLTSGAHLRTFQDPDPDTLGDSFGTGLAIGDNKLFVGAPGSDSLYAFDLGTGDIVWSITNPPIHGVFSPGGSAFGRGLALSGGRLLATTPSYVVPFQGTFGGGFTIGAVDGEIKRFFDNPEPNDGDALGVLMSWLAVQVESEGLIL